MNFLDTIAAISTPLGRGGLGVVRLSGPGALEIASLILRVHSRWQPRAATLADLLDDEGNVVDNTVTTWFAAPRSYTGQGVVEISCHGSPVVLRHCLERATRAGARLAEPGEFTLRAYVNGRIDLPQAEAIRDLIEATTLYQARVAAQQLGGISLRRLAPLKDQLLESVALLEAGIDFAEDDVSVASADEILTRLSRLRSGVVALARSFEYGRLVHAGVTLAIVGRPNVGKSSLFNRLVEQDRAIVTDIPGTTRDTVSEVAAIGGIPVKFVDTAGIREGSEVVESLGIERSLQAMVDADVRIVVVDASAPLMPDDAALVERASPCIIAANKIDKGVAADPPAGAIYVSAHTGEGIDKLRTAILPATQSGSEPGFITSVRHAELLNETLEALDHAEAAVRNGIPHEMLLLDLYAALGPLDAITGATTADDILNRIFATFCIGK